MINVLIVGAGGFIGSASRFIIYLYTKRIIGSHWFPLGTFSVNFIGCLLIGIMAKYTDGAQISDQIRYFLFFGILGGFTTFSAFSLDSLVLLKSRNFTEFFIYITLSVTICITATWIGYHIVK